MYFTSLFPLRIWQILVWKVQLSVKYRLTDPADGPGVFVDADLKELYGQLVEKGLNSIVDALEVGIIIKEEDIADLEYYLGLTDKKDIKQVFENLLEGSKNHLDAFDRNLENY